MFFLLGSLVEETPCEHGENMQTPHRKARVIAHLSTVHSGEDLPPRANSAPCGNRTHDILAVRQQCKQCKLQLSHRATILLITKYSYTADIAFFSFQSARRLVLPASYFYLSQRTRWTV